MGYIGPGDHEGWAAPLFADEAIGCGWHKGGVMVTELGDGTKLDYDDWQARPPADIVGWVATCSCGWRGQPWRRDDHSTALVNPSERRVLAMDGDYGDLSGDDENLVIEEWRRHIAPHRAVESVEEAAEEYAAASRKLDEAVAAAKAAGASWTDVGRAVGITRQSAHERWAARV